MNINIDDLKKKIIYRSTYRGTKEMDTLLSSFTKKYINNFNYLELTQLLQLLDIDDENIYKLNRGQKISIIIEKNKVINLFMNFNLNKK